MKINSLVNVALIGCGRISKKHFDAIMKLTDKGVTLRAAADLDLAKCNAYTQGEAVRVTADFEIEGFFDSADLAVILTESGNHFKHAKYALEAGLDVLVEKPVTLKLEDAKELKSIAKINGRKVYVVKQNRFNDPVLRAREFIKRGFLGKPQITSVQVRWCRPQEYYDLADWRGTWAMDGGVISNQASHHVDLMRWFMGPVKSVQALERRFSVDIETEDTVVALLEFASGAIGTLEATTSTRPRNLEGSFSVQGSEGAFEVGGFAVNEMRYMESNSKKFLQGSLNRKSYFDNDTSDVYGSGHISIYNEILKDRLNIQNEAVTIDDAIETLEVIHMIYRSIETGQRICVGTAPVNSLRMGF
jgi:predicted dehydrogenase